MSQGGDAALEENEARLREKAERAENLKREKDVVSNEIDKLKEDIAKQQVRAGPPLISFIRVSEFVEKHSLGFGSVLIINYYFDILFFYEFCRFPLISVSNCIDSKLHVERNASIFLASKTKHGEDHF